MEADLAVEDARVLGVLGLQLDQILVDGRTGQLGQSLSDFFAGDFAVKTAGGTEIVIDENVLALEL